MNRFRQIWVRLVRELPAQQPLIALAPDLALVLLRGFIALGIAGSLTGPLVDLLWHHLDPAHDAWYAIDWINLGMAVVWLICLWATYVLSLRVAVCFHIGISVVCTVVIVFVTGGIDSPDVLVFAVPLLVGVMFLGLRGSGLTLVACLAGYATVYAVEVHAGIRAPQLIHGDADLTHVLVATTGLVVVWVLAWMISASLRLPLYERIRSNALEHAQMVERERLLAMVSHELRTPLTNIVGFVDMLQRPGQDLTHATREGLQANAVQLLTMVNNMLDYAKSGVAGHRVVSEPVDVASMVAQILAMFRPALQRQGTTGDVHCEPQAFPALQLDRFALERVVTNLVSNAVKHTRHGRVLVDLAWHGGQLTVKVVDTGSGMSPQTLARVFEPFFHDASSGVAGTGLGMALVQQMVQRLGGQIAVVSQPGQGTSVTVQMPASVAHLPTSELAPGAARAPAVSAGDGSALYLFVEDQADIRALIEAFMQTLGYPAVVVAALDDIPDPQVAFAGAFVDLQLAGASGSDVRQQLRERSPQLRVWAMTANLMFQPEQDRGASQFDGVLYKPFTLQQLEDALTDIRA